MSVEQLTTLDGRYLLTEVIGRGGMADVYRATDQVLHREVAVKILRETADGPQRGRFTAEARTLASLSHPGLITLLDAGFQADHPYLVMELVEGSTLSAVIAQASPSPSRVARIGAALAEALAYAHGAGVVHRDVKPSNVLVCGEERVLLADFGIARLIDATEHHTRTDEAVGSPAYLAPEQVAGEQLTTAVDVYSLGLVLLESLTGVRAYGGTPVEAAIARLSADPEVPASIGTEWGALIRSMTARDPGTRPTAAEVASTLGALALPEAIPAERGAPVEETRVLDIGAETAVVAPARLSSVAWRVPTLTPATVALIVGSVLALALLITLIIAGADNGSSPPADPTLPDRVPAELQEPLRNLHRAVEEPS